MTTVVYEQHCLPRGAFGRIRGRLFASSPNLELDTHVPDAMCFNLLASETMVSTNATCLPPEHHILSTDSPRNTSSDRHLPTPPCPYCLLVVPLKMVVQPTVNLREAWPRQAPGIPSLSPQQGGSKVNLGRKQPGSCLLPKHEPLRSYSQPDCLLSF